MTGKKTTETTGRLGVGFIGSGFNARFHMQAFRAVRDADVLGVWSPNKKNAVSAAELARNLDVGDAKAYASIAEMVADPAIDAIWLRDRIRRASRTSRRSCTRSRAERERSRGSHARNRWRGTSPKRSGCSSW